MTPRCKKCPELVGQAGAKAEKPARAGPAVPEERGGASPPKNLDQDLCLDGIMSPNEFIKDDGPRQAASVCVVASAAATTPGRLRCTPAARCTAPAEFVHVPWKSKRHAGNPARCKLGYSKVLPAWTRCNVKHRQSVSSAPRSCHRPAE